MLDELFPFDRGGVPDYVITAPITLRLHHMPEMHPDAESVLDMLDGVDVGVRSAPVLRERRARRVEERREAARRELLDLALDEEEAAERAERRRRAEEARNAAATEQARRAVERNSRSASDARAPASASNGAERSRIAGAKAGQQTAKAAAPENLDRTQPVGRRRIARLPSLEGYYQFFLKTIVLRAYPTAGPQSDVEKLAADFIGNLRIDDDVFMRHSMAWRCDALAQRALFEKTYVLARADRSYAIRCMSTLTSPNGRMCIRLRLDDLSKEIRLHVLKGESYDEAVELVAPRSTLLDQPDPSIDVLLRNAGTAPPVAVRKPADRFAAPHQDAGSDPASRTGEARKRRVNDHRGPERQAATADASAKSGSTRAGRTWSAPVVVPIEAQPQPPRTTVPIPGTAVPMPRTDDGGPRDLGQNILQFPLARRPVPIRPAPVPVGEPPKRRGRPPGRRNSVVAPQPEPRDPPVLRTEARLPPRQVALSARPLLKATFPLPAWESIVVVRDRWFRTTQHDVDLLNQARAALPSDCIRWRVRNGEVPFSEVVASVMTAGGRGARLLLFNDADPGVAAIDVRCPRPQLVERWSKCLLAAKASLPAGRIIPSASAIDEVVNLRVDLSVSTLVDCLQAFGLGLAIGPVEG